jgi:excisionase family DNA binding protein
MAGELEQHTTITIPEIADRLGVCEETVYDLCKRHIIPSIRPGRRFIMSRTACEKWEASIGTDKLVVVHHNLMPGCRERIRPSWDLREQALYAQELLASFRSNRSKKPESP